MKNKIYFLKGLQGSGKTTKAKEILQSDGNSVRLNKDDLRQTLFCSNWKPRREKAVVLSERHLAKTLLSSGYNVILDNTHFNPAHETFYRELAKENNCDFELINLETNVFECIRRDNERKIRGERYVGADVILNTAFENNIYRSPRHCIVSDLDGTLADCAHRRHYVRNVNNDPNFKKDWPSFFARASEDMLRKDVWDQICKTMNKDYDFIIVSARPENYRALSEKWLADNGIQYDRFIMRPANDNRPDTVVKQEIIDKYLDKSKILKWFDDRPSVVAQVRSNGINVVDVGNGEEF